jgi:16S rRNA (cytosine967-C5)-methyltransferase
VALLHGVLTQGRPLDAQLGTLGGRLAAANDRALAHALAANALRWLIDLDALIDSATERPIPPDARARQVLRVALAGWLCLETPPHAVIATALPIVTGGPRRLVHGVLGTLLRGEGRLPAVPTLPPAWAARWHDAWGPAMVADAARALATPAALDLCLKDAGRTAEYAALLGATSLLPGHLRLENHGAVDALAGFAAGDWWVQDIAAQLPARLLGAVAGERVLDLCAAPGGKTMQLAATGADVLAVDSSAVRMRKLAANLARTGLAAETLVADALHWQPNAPFDAILLDAPCSASGIFRRHPDALHLKSMGDLAALSGLAATQAALLARAAGWLRPGGRLVYAVCSLEPAEGEAIVAGCPLAPAPITAAELPAGMAPTAAGHARSFPGQCGGADGFFMARFARPLQGTD